MNREIKFRAWDKKTNSWYDDSNQHLVIDLDGTLTNCWNGELMEDYTERIILLPFTGLEDKNGVEIYEGDIYHHGDPRITYTVVWVDSGLKGKQNSSTSYAGLESWCYQIEVIGNVYENPELLEVEA